MQHLQLNATAVLQNVVSTEKKVKKNLTVNYMLHWW